MVSNVHPNMIMDKKAKAFSSLCLYSFAKDVALKAAEVARAKDALEPVDVQYVLRQFLDSTVADHANSQGCRALSLYELGMQKFKPKKRASIQEDEDLPTKRMKLMKLMPKGIKMKKGLKGKAKTKQAKTPPPPPPVKIVRLGTKFFRRGITGLAAEFSNRQLFRLSVKLDRKFLLFLEDALFNIVTFIASCVGEACQNAGITEMGDTELSETIKEVFPTELQHHAITQGASYVSHFADGIIQYKKKVVDPDKPRHRRPRSKGSPKRSKSKRKGSPPKPIPQVTKQKPVIRDRPKKEIRPNFSSGIWTLVSQISPNLYVGLTHDATNYINRYLQDVCRSLVHESVAAESSELSAESIRKAVVKVFPSELAKLANTAGACGVTVSPAESGVSSSSGIAVHSELRVEESVKGDETEMTISTEPEVKDEDEEEEEVEA